MKPRKKRKKRPSYFSVGSCNKCNKDIMNIDSFVIVAKANDLNNKKRLCYSCYVKE